MRNPVGQQDLGLLYEKPLANVSALRDIVPSSCTRCRRAQYRKNIIYGEGSAASGVMVIGAVPDKESDASGVPFAGTRDGVLLERILTRAGITPRDTYRTYLCKCGIENPDARDYSKCLPYLMHEISAIQPRLVILFGKYTLKAFFPKRKLSTSHGALLTIDQYPGIQFMPVEDLRAVFADPSTESRIIGDIRRGLSRTLHSTSQDLPGDYSTITTIPQLKAALRVMADKDPVTLDVRMTDTSLFWTAKVAGWSIAWARGKALYFPITTCSWDSGQPITSFAWSESEMPIAMQLWREFLSPQRRLIFHGGKKQLKALHHLFNLTNLNYYWDTRISAKLVDNTEDADLGHLSWVYTNLGGFYIPAQHFIDTAAIGDDYTKMPNYVLAPYACGAADCIYRVYQETYKKVESLGQLDIMTTLCMPLSSVFLGVELAGVKVDRPYLEGCELKYKSILDTLAQQIYQLVGFKFNISSTSQLADVLFRRLKLPVIQMTDTQESSDSDTLKKLLGKHPVIQPLLEYRKASQIYKNFIISILGYLDADNRVHTEYKVGETETGRTASESPNMQNCPARNHDIKRAFIAASGNIFIAYDFSQIEVRVLADLSRDPKLIADLNSGLDMHRAIGSNIYGIPPDQISKAQRSAAKKSVFGIIYGRSYKTLAESEGMSEEEARTVYERFFTAYPGVRRWMDDVKRFAWDNHFVRSPFGRIRYLDYIDHPVHQFRAQAERCAVNTPIQSTGADIPNYATLELVRQIPQGPDSYMIRLQIHDEITVETPEATAHPLSLRIKNILETAVPLSVPTPVGIKYGINSGDMKEIEILPDASWVLKHD